MENEKRGETFVMQGGASGPVDFNTFLLGLASTALIHLGEVPHPETGQSQLDLVLARQSVDLLILLRDKTRGNLTPDEEKFFESLLSDLKMRIVAASRK